MTDKTFDPNEGVPETKEAPVQRFAYDKETNGYVGSHTGTLKEFEDFLGDIYVEGELPAYEVHPEQINLERDRRISAGLPFNGKLYDFDQRGKDNITGASALAKFALFAGAQPEDYTWHVQDIEEKKTALPFTWITQDNSMIPMDAPTLSAMGDEAANWESKHIFYARSIKSMSPIPEDFEDDKYWP